MTYRRILCLALALILLASYAPTVTDFARAEEIPAPVAEEIEAVPEDVEPEEAVAVEPVDDVVPVADDLVIGDEAEEIVEEEEIDLGAAEDVVDDEVYVDEDDTLSLEKSMQALFGAGTASNSAIKHNITLTQSGTTVTIKGSINAPYYVCGLFDENIDLITAVRGSSINQSINMNNYATGYHSFVVGVSDGPTSNNVVGMITLTYALSNKITDRPTYGGVFDVYSTALDFYPFDMYMHNQSGKLYLEYSSDGGKIWKRYGYMQANLIKLAIEQHYTVSGLAPNTTYLTRLRYGTFVTYSKDCFGDGKSYFFGGPVLNTLTFRTGAATAPAIKSVTLKAIKVKRHKVRHPGYYSYVGGTLFWHRAYTERYYTCKVRVIVKLKKKPGTNGMWVYFNGQRKYVKGNKKKYVATFTPYPNYFPKNPHRRYKYSVTVRSGQSSSYGGYSPAWTKTRKLK